MNELDQTVEANIGGHVVAPRARNAEGGDKALGDAKVEQARSQGARASRSVASAGARERAGHENRAVATPLRRRRSSQQRTERLDAVDVAERHHEDLERAQRDFELTFALAV